MWRFESAIWLYPRRNPALADAKERRDAAFGDFSVRAHPIERDFRGGLTGGRRPNAADFGVRSASVGG